MELSNFLSMFGGLALFLYGMHMASNGLEAAAGKKMQSVLEKLTSNRILGVGVGALITALIQSSSATTVMVVGFVNSGLMKLENAVWVIMGANIGTTITGQLIAIDITALAPLIAFVGVALIVFFRSNKLDAIGSIIAGIGIIFIGMDIMSTAMIPLRTMPEFLDLITKFENPLIGILVGAAFTAVIQSSAASVGILQALAISGVITLPSAIYVLFGQNIGTCITSLLASIGTNRNAKRATAIHLSFNIIGTIIFVFISMVTPFAAFVQSITPTNVVAQIANVHTIFNIVTTVLLLPFGKQLVKLAYIILPEKQERVEKMSLKYLNFDVFTNDYRIGTSAIANTQLFNEVQNMLNVTTENVEIAFNLITDYSEEKYNELIKNEEYINYLNKEITKFTTNAILVEFESEPIGLFLKISGDLERIGDHASAIASRAKIIHEDNMTFSDDALEEVKVMSDLTKNILHELKIMSYDELNTIAQKVDVIEESIDATTNEFSVHQLKRLSNKQCTPENSVLFTKILFDFERIGDHGLNIAVSFKKVRGILAAMKMAE